MSTPYQQLVSTNKPINAVNSFRFNAVERNRGGEKNRAGETTSGIGVGREGKSPRGLGVAGGDEQLPGGGGESRTSRTDGGESTPRRTSRGELGTSRGGAGPAGGGAGPAGGASGMSNRAGEENGGAGEEIGGAGRSPRSLLFSRASVSWPRGKFSRSPIWRAKLAALVLAPASAPPPRRPAPGSATMAIVEATGFA